LEVRLSAPFDNGKAKVAFHQCNICFIHSRDSGHFNLCQFLLRGSGLVNCKVAVAEFPPSFGPRRLFEQFPKKGSGLSSFAHLDGGTHTFTHAPRKEDHALVSSVWETTQGSKACMQHAYTTAVHCQARWPAPPAIGRDSWCWW
jgi:hypothetical protein